MSIVCGSGKPTLTARCRRVDFRGVDAPPETDPLVLGRRIIDVLQSGSRTSTYKLATLQAPIECCAERVPSDPHRSVEIPIDELTHRVIELYWPQTRPLAWNDNRPLRQASEGSEILAA